MLLCVEDCSLYLVLLTVVGCAVTTLLLTIILACSPSVRTGLLTNILMSVAPGGKQPPVLPHAGSTDCETTPFLLPSG